MSFNFNGQILTLSPTDYLLQVKKRYQWVLNFSVETSLFASD